MSHADAPAFDSQTITVPGVPRPSHPPPPEYLLTPPVPPGSGLVWRTSQEAALREAMLRYSIDNAGEPFGQDKTKRFSVCYLSVGDGKELSPVLLE